MPTKDCPTRQALLSYHTGELAEEAAQPITGHLSQCSACQAALETFDEVDDTLVARLRQPAAEHACLEEPECQSAVDRAGAVIERSLSTATRSGGGGSTELGRGGQLGEYLLLEKLGQGGMGVVYKARHTKLGRTVALKLLPAGLLQSSRAVARFEREMLAIGGLSHPNIVQAHDAREVDDVRFLVMEFVEGLDLHKLARRLGPLQTADACELIRQAALGLQYAHEHGLVHRDVKPSNLMLSCEGRVKVLDLGLARLQEDQPAGEEMTAAGQAMGTADYMAPEQASDSHTVDVRADVYSLGCTLYSLLAGRPPFSGGKYQHTYEKMTAHAREPVPPIRNICPQAPDELVELLNRMLAKDPADRPSTPAEVAEAVASLCEGCDLPALLAQAEEGPERAGKKEASLASTDELAPSAVGTQPTHAPVPLPAARRWKPLAVVAVGLMLLAGVTYGVSQIVIRIRDKSGREMVIELPDDSEITVEKDGQIVGHYPVEEPSRPAPSDPEAGERSSPHPVDPDFVKAVAVLPPEEQIEAVREKLVQLNPGFDGELTHKITGGVVTELTFVTDHVIDLSPVRALEGLQTLTCGGSARGKGKLADLAPLRGLPLTRLSCTHTQVSDLLPLEGMPLTILFCGETEVSDLSPLEGMPLTILDCGGTKVSNLSPLAGMRLTSLRCHSTDVRDLSPLESMPLTRLDCYGTQVSDLSPLKGMPLTKLNCNGTQVSDLSPLEGMPLTELNLYLTQVFDLSSLEGIPLTKLDCHVTQVSSLAPLKGMPLTFLDCSFTPVSDLSLLEGMPLTTLYCRLVNVSDLSPLAGFLLKDLWCDFRLFHDADEKLVRGMTTLDKINRQPAAEFWRQVEARRQANQAFLQSVADLPAERRLEAVGKRLVELNPDFGGQIGRVIEADAVTEVTLVVEELRDLSPLRALPRLCKLRLEGPPHFELRDLSPLVALPLEELTCDARLVQCNETVLAAIPSLKTIVAVPQGGETPLVEIGEPLPVANRLPIEIQPEALSLEPGDPLSPLALVTRPAAVQRVGSWTIETRNHRGAIATVAHSPDGRLLASAGVDGSIRLWEASGEKLAGVLVGHADWVNAVAWSPDSRYLASAGRDGAVRLWDAAGGRPLRVLNGHQGPVRSVAWSPDGTHLLTGGDDGTLRTWDVTTSVPKLSVSTGAVILTVAWSPDGRLVASAGEDKRITVREAGLSNVVHALEQDDWIGSIAFSPDGQVLVGYDGGGEIRFWDVATGEPLYTDQPIRHAQGRWATVETSPGLCGVAFSPDGKRLASGGAQGSVRVWDVDSGLMAFELPSDSWIIHAVSWSPDGKNIASGSYWGDCSIWDVGTGRESHVTGGLRRVGGVAWSPDGRTLAHNSLQRDAIWLWDTSLDNPPRCFTNCPSAHPFWLPDGKTLLTRDSAASIYLMDAESGDTTLVIRGGMQVDGRRIASLGHHDVSLDGSMVAGGSSPNGTAWVFSVLSGELLHALEGHTDGVHSVAFAPDGKKLATSSNDGTVRLWDLQSEQVLWTKEMQAAQMAWSPDGKKLAIRHSWGVAVLDPATGEALSSVGFGKKSSRNFSFVFDREGKTLVADATGDLCSWDIETGQRLRTLEQCVQIWQAKPSWSPDFRLLAAVGYSPLISIWEPKTGRLHATLLALESEEGAGLAWTPEGHHRVLGEAQDAVVCVVQPDDGQQLTLTPEEFAQQYGWKNDPEKVRLDAQPVADR